MSEAQNMFLGIDLGTTNSSIAWGVYDAGTGLVQPKDLDFDQMIADGRREHRALLPSYIYFKQGEDLPYVGEFARAQGLQFQPSRVVKAVKNHMGKRDWRFQVDGAEFTPAQLSATLLKTMYAGIKATWGFAVPDVVICVPASFDSDMRRDTIEAARLAGFKVAEKNGAERNLILDEPRAALFDLVNRQRSKSIPKDVIDFSSTKTVLVFDLGGGTLDVSLHKVSQPGETSPEIQVQDLAISRYTQLGGGVFDTLIADELQRRFEEKTHLKLEDLTEIDRQMIRFKLEDQAERLKVNMTNLIKRRIDNGEETIPQSLSGMVQIPFLYDQHALITNVTKQHLDDLIAPLLGWEFSLKDVDRFAEIDYSRANNIIYPVLDVLLKARERLGTMPKVDAVVLNGGMTRMYQVQQRLEQFFGIRPITILDPDKSVSRGAAVYHFLLHQGYKASSILAESVGVLVKGNRIYHLAKAGTVLPFRKTYENLLATPDDISTIIAMPLYRGEMPAPVPPNQRLAEAKFILKEPLPVDTPIHVELSIDDNKVVSFMARVASTETSLMIDQSGRVHSLSQTQPELKPGNGGDPSKGFKKTARIEARSKPTGPEYNMQGARNMFRQAQHPEDLSNLKSASRRILNSSNIDELVEMLIRDCETMYRIGREEALRVMGEFARLFPDDPLIPKITQVCLRHLEARVLNNPRAINSYGRTASIALGKIGNPVAESQLIGVISNETYVAARQDAIFALGKCGRSLNALMHVSKYVESSKVGERLASCWAIGHIGSRENETPVDLSGQDDMITMLGKLTATEEHETVRKYAVYALGELCDQRGTNIILKVSADLAGYARALLVKVKNDMSAVDKFENEEIRQTRLFLDIALIMVTGASLSEEQIVSLAAIRALAAVND